MSKEPPARYKDRDQLSVDETGWYVLKRYINEKFTYECYRRANRLPIPTSQSPCLPHLSLTGKDALVLER